MTSIEEIHEKVHIELTIWLNTNLHIKKKISEKVLKSFEKRCNYNVRKIKEKIVNFVNIRNQNPEWFLSRDPKSEKILEILSLGCFLPLKEPFEDKIIIIVRAAVHNPVIHCQNDVLKCSLMILDLLIYETGITKALTIIDMNNVALAHATALTPKIIKNLVFCWKNYHIKSDRFDFINAPSYVNVILDIFKRFISYKMKKKIFIHYNNVGDLFDTIPKDKLPIEYDGKTDSIPELINYWKTKLLNNSEWFSNNN